MARAVLVLLMTAASRFLNSRSLLMPLFLGMAGMCRHKDNRTSGSATTLTNRPCNNSEDKICANKRAKGRLPQSPDDGLRKCGVSGFLLVIIRDFAELRANVAEVRHHQSLTYHTSAKATFQLIWLKVVGIKVCIFCRSCKEAIRAFVCSSNPYLESRVGDSQKRQSAALKPKYLACIPDESRNMVVAIRQPAKYYCSGLWAGCCWNL